MAVCFIEAGKRKGNRKPANKMKATIFCNLITEMTFHHQILQAKTSHYIQPTLKERRIKKETRTRRWGSLEVILEICLKKWKVKVKSLSHIQLFATPWAIAYQTPPSMAFSRQEYWSGLPFPSPRDLPDPGIEPRSPALQADSLPSLPPGKPKNIGVGSLSLLQGNFLTQESNQGLLHCRGIVC